MTNRDMAIPRWNIYLELLAAETQMRSQPDYSNTDACMKFYIRKLLTELPFYFYLLPLLSHKAAQVC